MAKKHGACNHRVCVPDRAFCSRFGKFKNNI